MKHNIDLTKDNFNRINFSEAEIVDFYCKKVLPENFDFSIWGATILLAPHWSHEKNFITPCDGKDLYVSGIGTIRLTGLLGGTIEVFIYDSIRDENNRIIAAKNHDNSELVSRRHWGHTSEFSIVNEYIWECVMSWPYGFCNLRLYVHDTVVFEYDTQDTVLVDSYLKNPHLYSFEGK